MTTMRFDRQEANTAASCFFNDDEKLLISACSIMKNEMRHIEQWLRNVRIFADEIIVADTGSTDGIREYLQQQTDVRLIEYEWDNDFSRARNTAWAEAVGKWVTFLDADETFYHPENVRHWLEIVEEKADYFDTVMVPIKNVDEDRNDCLIAENMVPRIFRNHAGVRYKGAVHEQPAKSEGKISIMLANDLLAIRHTGYSSSLIKAKHRRNLPLMLSEYKNSAAPEKYCGFLAECCFGLGKYADAARFAIEALRSKWRTVGARDGFYRILCLAMEKMQLPLEERLTTPEIDEVCQNALAIDKWLIYVLKSWLDSHREDSLEKQIDMLSPIYLGSRDDRDRLLAILEVEGYFDLMFAICQKENISMAWDDDMKASYELLASKKWEDLRYKAATNIPFYMQGLMIALLEGDMQDEKSRYQENIRLLPQEYQSILACLRGKSRQLSMDFGTYSSLVGAFSIYGRKEMLERYLALSDGLSGKEHIQLGDRLLELEQYEYALNEYAKVQQGDAAITGGFWFSAARCLYHLQEYPAAMEAIGRAAEAGCASGELEAYKAWCREKLT